MLQCFSSGFQSLIVSSIRRWGGDLVVGPIVVA
jgi:hypothetical protein